MQSDLDLLIELLETERKSLESSIKGCIEDFDYLTAYHYSEGLLLVNHQLYLLNCFKGPLYDEEHKLERMIAMLSEIIKDDTSGYLHTYWGEKVNDQKLKIQQLREQKSKWFNDSQEIDNALFDLYELKIKGFKLVLNGDDKFYLNFELDVQKLLVISIELIAIENSDYIYHEDGLKDRLFKKLGFKLNEDGSLLIYEYNMSGFKDASLIKILLSRIVYEIFNGSLTDASLLIYDK